MWAELCPISAKPARGNYTPEVLARGAFLWSTLQVKARNCCRLVPVQLLWRELFCFGGLYRDTRRMPREHVVWNSCRMFISLELVRFPTTQHQMDAR